MFELVMVVATVVLLSSEIRYTLCKMELNKKEPLQKRIQFVSKIRHLDGRITNKIEA